MLAIAIAAGIAIGVSLGALGGGGSILTVPVLVYALNESPKTATTASLIIVGISALTAAVGHARAGRVRWRAGILFGLLGSVASLGGSRLNHVVNPQALLLAFAGLMVVAATAMIARGRQASVAEPHSDDGDDEPAGPTPAGGRLGRGHDRSSPRPSGVAVLTGPVPARTADEPSAPAAPWDLGGASKVVVAALVVGFLTGFFGVGGGFVIVPALVVALHYKMPTAVGTSLIIIAINSVSALAVRFGSSSIPWHVVVPFTVSAMVGSLAGKRVADRVSAHSLTRAFAVLLVAVAVYVAIRASLQL